MTIQELQTLITNFQNSTPIIRGFPLASLVVEIEDNFIGLTIWLKLPIPKGTAEQKILRQVFYNGPEILNSVVKDEEELIKVLTKEQEIDWKFDDEA